MGQGFVNWMSNCTEHGVNNDFRKINNVFQAFTL